MSLVLAVSCATSKEEGPIKVETPARPAGQENALGLTVPAMDTVRVGFVGVGMRGSSAVERYTYIPGVKINITSGLDTFYDSYTDSIQKIKDQSGWTEYVKHKEKIEYSTAYANGYNWGANLQNSISEKLGLDLPDDPATGLLSNIADNTAQIADDVSVSSDDIKLLRDIAERQVINKYTTAEIKVEMVNHNNISNEMDLDGVVNLLEAKVTEALVTSAEGVHI